MSDFVFPYQVKSGFGNSAADQAAIQLLAGAVEELEVLPRHPKTNQVSWSGKTISPNQIATDTLVNLDEIQ